MISELLDEFPILGWRTYLLNFLNAEIVDKNNLLVINTNTPPWEFYSYGLLGEEHDQDLFST